MTSWIDRNPTYTPFEVPELGGNPLVEALAPPPTDNDEWLARLQNKPDFNESERALPATVRMFLPARLTRFFFPTEQHVKIFKGLYVQVLGGYLHRNPLTAAGQRLLHEGRNQQRGPVPDEGTAAAISVLTGLSGVGKSALVRRVMQALGKPVIVHQAYRGLPLAETQILYLMRNVPSQLTAKALCKSYGDYTDSLLGSGLYSRFFADKTMTRTQFVSELGRIVANHHVGILVLDEVQNLSLAGTRGEKELIALFINLREELGVPILLVGTHRAAGLLSREVSSARRLAEGGYHELDRPDSPGSADWMALCEIVWEYQWVRSPIPFEASIAEVLYELSQGVTAIMLTVFVASQVEAIDGGCETVTPDLLRRVYAERFRPLHPIINALRSRSPALLAKYDDIYDNAFKDLVGDPVLNRIETLKQEYERQQNAELGMESPTSKEHAEKAGSKRWTYDALRKALDKDPAPDLKSILT